MDFFKQLLSYIPQVAAVLIIVVAGGGWVIRLFNKDGTQDKNDVVNSANTILQYWKTQAEEYKIVIDAKDKAHSEKVSTLTTEFTKQITKLTGEVGELRGQLSAETNQKKEYLAILQNRDPETQKFMEFMVKAMENQDKILSEIFKIVKAEENRELKITSTVVKDGEHA